MSHPCEEPRFTIEQIDLLQRLWRSGMTQAEIVHALDTLERLERQHSRLPSPRSRPPPPRSSSSSTATQTCFPGNGASPMPGSLFRTSPPLLASAPTPVTMAVTENGMGAMANGKLSPPRFPVAMIGSSGGVVAQSYGFETSEEDLEFEEKVEELMRMDSAVIKEEIKNFLGNRRISQAVVSQVTGISATLAMRPAPMAQDELVEWHQTPPPFGSMPGGSRLRRGSRFTWRKECLSVMESYFGDNQYPDEAKREEIASSCNAVIQKPGKKLSDLERVTSLKVYNWFANRRKEMKRRANIEAAILESHGMDVVSPGGHSNSDEVDGNEFPEQGSEVSVYDKRAVSRAFGMGRLDLSSPTQVPSLLPSWLAAWPGLGRGAMAGQRGNPLIGRSLLLGAGAQADAARLTGVSWSPPSPSLQDEPTNHSSPIEVQDPISLAVEMAAVNHTILALANQASDGGAGVSVGNDIKSETMEDD
ncbi:hypothetical protein NHX12_005310 [Muraenolepis orangiensis]|uniref:Homeobox-containing protein 1-like n=1 Tax=Muraenolepis orangiensis TaxID=630683 RepID=A0A9Q0DRC1_9TELE|nr:hypothetical protein NHX12_005310 [Muraenolepis orangiensis]